MKIKALLSIAAITLLTSACSATKVSLDDAVQTHSAEAKQSTHIGSQWTLVPSVDDGYKFNDKQLPTITFKSQSQIAGFSGCNHFTGSYVKYRNLATVKLNATTRKMCTNIEKSERNFMSLFEKTIGLEIEGNQLAIFDRKGVLLAKFKR
jgi:heat shock protein HslJ